MAGGSSAPPPLLAPTPRGVSCARTLRAALEDTELRPEVVHIVGASDAERSLDWNCLAAVLPAGARVLLIGPHASGAERGAAAPTEERVLGPAEHSGLQVSVFPNTYQRFLAVCPDAEPPQFVTLFHPGLDIHYFAWYPCYKYWADLRAPVLVTAYRRPGGAGETPEVVKAILEAVVGVGGGAGMWVMEDENPHSIEEGAFNAAYYVTLGSCGTLPTLPEMLYFHVWEALRKLKYPFAPRVGYLDVGGESGLVVEHEPRLLAAIAEGALRGARCGEDAVDEEKARTLAAGLLDSVLGAGAGDAWRKSDFRREVCDKCGEGFDDLGWHRSVCPAMGATELSVGDTVALEMGAKKVEGVLSRFDKEKLRWAVNIGGREGLFQATSLRKV